MEMKNENNETLQKVWIYGNNVTNIPHASPGGTPHSLRNPGLEFK